jgi:hypothetical protein
MGEPFSSEFPHLLQHHLEQLRQSAISDEIIQERGYRSVLGTKELESLGFTTAQQRIPTLLIPIHSVDGKVVGHQHRPDNPRVDGKNKPIKYEKPKGQGNRIDCPPRCQKQLGDPTEPLWTTEGVKKADALASRKCCAIDLSGVWSWKGKNPQGGITILEDFDYIALNDRMIYLAFDSDSQTNPDVAKATQRLGWHLRNKGAQVYIIPIPQDGDQKVGVDDYLAAGHHVVDLMARACELPEKEAEVESREVCCAYFWQGSTLYLEVAKYDGQYAFAHLDGEQVRLISEVKVGQLTVKPKVLPKKEGIPLPIVGMPTEDIQQTKLLSSQEIYDKVRDHINHYVDLADLDLDLVVYYALFTWFYLKADTLGYLRFIADTGKGKSRAKKVVGGLCFYPLTASGASSFSGMARTQDRWRGTLIMDEADFSGEKAAQVTKYLNLGFERGQYYIMSDKQNPRIQELFDPFCPKVLAMREPFEDNATEARVLSVSMYETGKDDLPIILPPSYEPELQQLRNELALFALRHWAEVEGARMLDFKDVHIEPRLKQLAMPLSIIFQLWPEGVPHFKDYLVKRQMEVKRVRALSWEGSLFNLVYAIASGNVDLGSEFASYYTHGAKILQAITPTMVARQLRASPKDCTGGLISIGFDIEWVDVYFREEDSTTQKKRARTYRVPNERVWGELVSRYYYSEDNERINIPDLLRSKRYGVPSPVLSVPSVQKDETTLPVFGAPAESKRHDIFPLTVGNRDLTKEQVIAFWESVGKPIVHLGPGQNCLDLAKFLNGRVNEEQRRAIAKWIEAHHETS